MTSNTSLVPRKSRPRRRGGKNPGPADGMDVPAWTDWRTTDEHEINRRFLRALHEQPRLRNLTPEHPVFSNFEVESTSGARHYEVEIRDIRDQQFACECTDFRTNGLGVCKHVFAVLNYCEARGKRAAARAFKEGSDRIDVVLDGGEGTLRVERGLSRMSPGIRRMFDTEGKLLPRWSVGQAAAKLRETRAKVKPRISIEVEPWLEAQRQREERIWLRREYEQKVRSGEYPASETAVPLYPYQREGMLHLAFRERAMVADEMGLGKTIQAIAACALLHRLGKARRVLVVGPASLKTEWEEQIRKFTSLPLRVVFGPPRKRLQAYRDPEFFTIVNYEQARADVRDINETLRPDIVILDEAQRIKNWTTKTARAIKQLGSRYAFVLTGTPIENRIDELYSIVDFLDPALLGPLFRFNRDFYALDDRGKPEAYRQLGELHERIRPVLLRRRKADVEDQLPERTDRVHFVPLSDAQKGPYAHHSNQAAMLINLSKKRPLRQQEQEKLMREMNMMRMICDTNYILDPEDKTCPKLHELESVLDECLAEPEVKVLVFSEWVRMLDLVRERLEKLGIGYAVHTGKVPQQKRRAEIRLFKSDPDCRVFLCSESGGVGLNLQEASVVINCDLPWNPAKLEQRIARAWRKHQKRPVTVVNLVSANTIEHGMLATLDAKKSLAEGVLDLAGDLDDIPIKRGGQAFVKRLELAMHAIPEGYQPAPQPKPKQLPADRAAAFAAKCRDLAGESVVACEERYPLGDDLAPVLLVVVDRDAEAWRARLEPAHAGLYAPEHTAPDARPRLEVVDRATHEALARLEEAGLVQRTIRATRCLHPAESPAAAPDALPDEDVKRLGELTAQAARKLKSARLLAGEDLEEEVRRPVREAAGFLAAALALRHRLPEPDSLEDALRPPLLPFWKETGPDLQAFADDDSQSGADLIAPLDALREELAVIAS